MPIRSRALSRVSAFLAALLLAAAPRPAPAGERDVLIRMDDRQIRAAGIELARVEPEAGTAQTVLPGTVVVPPQQLIVVAAPAAGLIEAVLVAQNEAVRAGQPIARLRSTDLLEAQRT
ncbi:MAG: biotin/lipoyl-binding protein, partial [Acetobacteraceae bacterium]|nr:biotin/lipoyl-binding protein [Acetobacteraceae bacterium]